MATLEAHGPSDPVRPKRRAPVRIAALMALGAVALVTAGALGAAFVEDDGQGGAAQGTGVLPSTGGGTPDTDVGRVYAAAGPGVVSVQVGSASGTGFVIDRDGTIVTNAHVVGDAKEARVRFGDRGRRLGARVLGTDPSSDLAAIKVDPTEAGQLDALPLGDSSKVEVGDSAIAIGHPFGLDRTATAGIVSGVGREIRAPNGFQIDEVIQTDAPINPGNSGGPLLDSRGRVIGVNSQIASGGSRGNVGIGFAVPSNVVREVIPRLRGGKAIERPYLGVTTSEADNGARVEGVTTGGPAADAGLRPGADVIRSIAGRLVDEPGDLSRAIADLDPGDRVELEVERDGERRTVRVELGKRPDGTP